MSEETKQRSEGRRGRELDELVGSEIISRQEIDIADKENCICFIRIPLGRFINDYQQYPTLCT